MNKLLQQLTEAVGVAGDEYEVRSLIRDLIVDDVDEWRVDALGNIIALRRGSGDGRMRVLVDAHMDEVGLIISAIDGNGMLQFATVGGIDAQSLAGKVVQVGRKRVKGVIGLRPVHLISSTAERRKKPSISSLRIDIGASSRDSAAAKVTIGDRVAFVGSYQESEFGRKAFGKAFDNRAGCAALIELLRGERYPFDLYAVFSVQEEVGLRGAATAAYQVQPDVALVLESTPAYDLPNDRGIGDNTQLGAGPALYVMDSGTVQDPRLVAHLMSVATENGIPYQMRRAGGGGTNTASIQRAGLGCAAATIGLPGRYAHTASMMIDLDDYQNYLELADRGLRALTPTVVART